MAASSLAYPSRLIGRSKVGPDNSHDKMKQDQYENAEKLAIEFIEVALEITINQGSLHQELKDGVILCSLVNQLKPGTIKTVGQKDLSFIKMDNITRFLQGARQVGLEEHHLFDTIDLFEAKDMPRVIHTILTLSQLFIKHDPDKYSWIQTKGGFLPTSTTFHSNLGKSTSSSILQLGEKKKNNQNNQNQSTPQDTDLDKSINADSTFSTTSTHSTTSPHDDNIDDDNDQQQIGEPIKYRDVRDIFTCFQDTKKDITTDLSYTNGLDWYDHSNTTTNTNTTNISNTTTNLLVRPPKSPLRASLRCKSKKQSKQSSKTMNTSLSPSSSCSSLVSLLSNYSSSSPESPNTPLDHHHEFMDPIHTDSNISTCSNHSRQSSHKKKQQQKSNQHHQDEDKVRLYLQGKDGATAQYQLGNCIGKGQFASVYRALDLGTGEIVAIKRIKLEDGEQDEEMMKEIALLKTMNHFNVIKYLGFIRNRNHLNIILEYAENGSLMSTLKSFGAFPEKLVASFCIKILNGLDYLHENDVVHCDLKAANILTTKTGNVKLTDFGVSLNLKIKKADDETVSGTPNWMAPEVIELEGASTKSDIWSLGCTLIELVTGKPPYADLISMSAMFRIVEDDYPPLPDNISKEMQDFLLCCFQKNPNERPTAKELKEHPWLKLYPQANNNHQHSNSMRSIHSKMSIVPNSQDILPYSSTMDSIHQTSSIQPLQPLHIMSEEHNSHRFIQTSFGKTVECKVCSDLLHEQAIFCETCSLICHEGCKKLAFSCPPKVNEQQPSYDWVFSAKIYNRNSNRETKTQSRSELPANFGIRRASTTRVRQHQQQQQHFMAKALHDHPQAENILKYSKALGLTKQEQQALLDNPALLSHTMALEESMLLRNNGSSHKMKGVNDDQCIIT
ncbi:kinase-like domain-containing protein [Cunninghamella echinulata]|nr:kinase-like domain-containing protein [Cunninghamella echinulata]